MKAGSDSWYLHTWLCSSTAPITPGVATGLRRLLEVERVVDMPQGCCNARVLTCALAAAACRNGTPQEMAAAFIGGASAVSPLARQLQRPQQRQARTWWRIHR
jgi:hypothetical protein